MRRGGCGKIQDSRSDPFPFLRAPLLGRRGIGEATDGSLNFEPEILLVSQTRPRDAA